MEYEKIISVENLLLAWREFIVGKKSRKDVQEFQLHLMDNIFSLHHDLKSKTYIHGNYTAFNISDPKPRNIHKATVRDRLLHHLIYQELYSYFDSKFIHDSYSCRVDKGTHKAIDRFHDFYLKVSKNHTKTCWVLKCDIKKFFANIDHNILKTILSRSNLDSDTRWLLGRVIDSFHSSGSTAVRNPKHIYAMADMCKGLPLGNLTSQLLVNVYMDEFDQFMKRELKVKYYLRYADDFVVLSEDKNELSLILQYILVFLEQKLKLELHPDKVFIRTFVAGVDFLGWVHFPKHRVLRTSTKRRMVKNVNEENKQSYFGMLGHGDGYKLEKRLLTL